MRGAAAAAVLMLAAVSCSGGGDPVPTVSASSSFTVTSTAFENEGSIPSRYTCDGEDVSPALEWNSPEHPAGYVVVVTDEDAPGGGFIHWTVVDIPSGTTGLDEGAVPSGAAELENDFGDPDYGGPCPPEGDGPHRYVFTVYALARIPEGGVADRPARDAISAIQCCVSARGTLVGTYGR